MSVANRLALALLWIALFASAVAVVWAKHEARSLFIELQALTKERDALDIEWGQLKLEQGAWATHGRVEQTARGDLHMLIPRPEEVRLVKAED
ncbi:MAG TPA: cell division protein FtsL [Steroidobacteraceae bacterium]|jgi:cell division protein FtsL